MGCCSSKENPESGTMRAMPEDKDCVVKRGIKLYPHSSPHDFILAHYGGSVNFNNYVKSRESIFESNYVEKDEGFDATKDETDPKKKYNGKGKVFLKIDEKPITVDGDFESAKLKSGIIEYENGPMYEADYTGNSANGKGKITYPDKSVYTGEIKNDLKHGQGRYEFPSGSYYEGEFKGETRTGKGKHFNAPKGQTYEGDFFCDMKHGKGKLTWKDGTYYEGDWVRNKMEGQGKFIKINGNTYEGGFLAGKKSGKGVEKNKLDNWEYNGMYQNDDFHGNGVFIDPQGVKFEGPFVNGFKKGAFVITSSKGQVMKKEIDEEKEYNQAQTQNAQ